MEPKANPFCLQVTDQHIALAHGLVECQLSTVHMLASNGLDATKAKLLLDELEGSLEALVDNRSIVERAIRDRSRGVGGSTDLSLCWPT